MKRASKNNSYHYNKELQPYANELKHCLTKGEQILWKNVLHNRQMKGFQFRLCRPVLDYIAEFICRELLLIIEIDGISRFDAFAQPINPKRDATLKEIGFTILRFSEWEVLNRRERVIEAIEKWIDQQKVHSVSTTKKRKAA